MSAVLAPVARHRPFGRVYGVHDPEHCIAGLAADWDCCWLEGRLIASLQDWQDIVAAGRLAEVNGAFALAWTDADSVLHLARDAIGERTLYWAKSGARIVYGSTLKPLLDSGLVDRRIDLESLAAYLSWAYIPGERTLVDGIREILPGEIVSFGRGDPRRTRYWSVPAEPAAWREDEEAMRVELRRALEAAMIRKLAPGGPVAATLSGGIDSSLVVALATKLHAGPVHTFSVSFGAGHANELPWSSMVASHCGTRHRVVEISPQAVLANLDNTIARHADPIGDPLTVPNALLFRETATEAEVVLNGEGGDPCFGGPKNLPMLLAGLFEGTLDARGAAAFASEASYLRAHLKCYDDLADMLQPDAFAALAGRPLERFVGRDFGDPAWRSMVARLQWMNLVHKGAHQILHKLDEVSAPEGVLPRTPLFDREVVECAFRIPPQLKLRGSVEKYLLKRAVADLLPGQIIDRPKSGMLVPVEGWFRGPLKAAARERILDGLAPWGLFEQRWLERLLAGKLGGLRPRHGVKTWLLVTLEAWLRKVLR